LKLENYHNIMNSTKCKKWLDENLIHSIDVNAPQQIVQEDKPPTPSASKADTITWLKRGGGECS
jgi:hypothetical protein